MVNNQDLKENNMLDNGAVDTDIKSESNLLNNSDSVQDVATKASELQTEVTTIAEQEQLSGQKIDVGTPDDLYAKAASSYIRNMKMLNDIVRGRQGSGFTISRKGMNRVINAILQLPQDGLPVKLENDAEMAVFGIGQRIIADRYLMTHYHIVQQQKEMLKKKQEEAAAKASETKTEGENNEQQ
jgi:hypothetical protein